MRLRLWPRRRKRSQLRPICVAVIAAVILVSLFIVPGWHGGLALLPRPQYRSYVQDACTLTDDGDIRCPSAGETVHIGGDSDASHVIAVRTPSVAKWRAQPRLVVLGILVQDLGQRGDGGHSMAAAVEAADTSRRAQRVTWGAMTGVARKSNDFTGALLLLYVRPFNAHKPTGVDAVVKAEMEAWEDTLLLGSAGGIRKGGSGDRREEKQVMGVKAALRRQRHSKRLGLLFYLYVVDRLRGCPFVATAHEDSFVYVPEFLRTVRQLPRVSTLYGRVRGLHVGAEPPSLSGPVVVVTSDVAEEVAVATVVDGLVPLDTILDTTGMMESPASPVLSALYGNGKRRRQAVVVPLTPTLETPWPFEGWGAAYMRFMRAPSASHEVGFAALLSGASNVSVQFPWHGSFERAKVVLVADNCRLLTGPLSLVAARVPGAVALRGVTTSITSLAALHALEAWEAAGVLPQPRKVDFLAGTNYSYSIRFMVDVCGGDQLEAEYGPDRFPIPLA